ncbi:MAG: hypothetical protein IPJ65_13220 [Archangiaceae bacterium]|nr:hypothetical protein [Archangiaceae bacterium]
MVAVMLSLGGLLAGCLEPAAQLELDGTGNGGVVKHCSPLNCTGCCAGDVCLGGNTDEACGYDGRGCNTCPSTHRCEAPGACYPVPTMSSSSSTPPPLPDSARCFMIDGSLRCQ